LISRDKDVPIKTMNRKVIDSQQVQGRLPQRRSLGILGKDEVASSNLASSSKTPDSTWNREFFFCSTVHSILDLAFLNSGILQED